MVKYKKYFECLNTVQRIEIEKLKNLIYMLNEDKILIMEGKNE